MSEFDHQRGCKSNPENCSGCALTTGGAEGPNYAAWPISYLRNGRSIPEKWMGALKKELQSENKPYVEHLKTWLFRCGYDLGELEKYAINEN